MAIVLDGKVQSAPVIQDRIGGGRAVITGSFTLDEARDLALVLRAGALPAPVVIAEERTVGPSLGRDSVAQGIRAMIIGFLAVVLFMVIYYRLSGALAIAALVANLFVLVAVMSMLPVDPKPALTLPGLAGIILTIGMAVDANVLIFERIKEEIRNQKTIRAAIRDGYDRAFLTILDSNLTTLIAAAVLWKFGTGPVRGFAVTLSLGIIASMFTAIVATRVVYDFLTVHRNVKRLSI
jgi:preprotein translocase subunit SecD